MAEKKRGISRDLLIHPGEPIGDLIVERDIAQKELARRVGISEAFLSDVINGKKDISKSLARGLEYAFGVSSSFWLNLQAKYDAELLTVNEAETITEEEKAVLKTIREVVGYLRKKRVIPSDLTKEESVLSLRRIFGVSDLRNLKHFAADGAFRMSRNVSVVPEVTGAWLCMCKTMAVKTEPETAFSRNNTAELICELKKLMCKERKNPEPELTHLLEKYGIAFSVMPHFRGAPVQGFISKKKDDTFQMVLTLRGSSADIFWFSLMHELGHIVNGDLARQGYLMDMNDPAAERKEQKADQFASDALLGESDYSRFISEHGYKNIDTIKSFAKSQGVPPFIVIGRLQKEKKIPYSYYSDLKPQYKWAD